MQKFNAIESLSHVYDGEDNLPTGHRASDNAHEHRGGRPERNVGNYDLRRVGSVDADEAYKVAGWQRP